jgi:hypothetical protein
MLGDAPVDRLLVFERQETETSRFFLLLVVHDNNFHNLPEPGEERPQIGLRHIGG